jgi:hypothetical protein
MIPEVLFYRPSCSSRGDEAHFSPPARSRMSFLTLAATGCCYGLVLNRTILGFKVPMHAPLGLEAHDKRVQAKRRSLSSTERL